MVRTKDGYATFMTVLVIMGLILMFMGLGSLSSISFGKLGLSVSKGVALRAGFDGCLEEALLRLRNDWRYDQESFDLNGISCQINVSGNGLDRTVEIGVTSDHGKLQGTAVVKRKGFSVNLIGVNIDE